MDSPSHTRRELLARGARYLMLGGFAAFFAQQLLRAKELEGDPRCIKLHTCRDCIELSSGCRLPEAEEYRAATGPGASGRHPSGARGRGSR